MGKPIYVDKAVPDPTQARMWRKRRGQTYFFCCLLVGDNVYHLERCLPKIQIRKALMLMMFLLLTMWCILITVTASRFFSNHQRVINPSERCWIPILGRDSLAVHSSRFSLGPQVFLDVLKVIFYFVPWDSSPRKAIIWEDIFLFFSKHCKQIQYFVVNQKFYIYVDQQLLNIPVDGSPICTEISTRQWLWIPKNEKISKSTWAMRKNLVYTGLYTTH